MKMTLLILLLLVGTLGVLARSTDPKPNAAAELPTLYEYYTKINMSHPSLIGLEANHPDHFLLNGKPFVIYGGSLHYFRVHPDNWRLTLQKFKAAGLNTVQLYVPWNLHEEIPGEFDFGEKNPFLDLDRFLREIQQADMFAIVRPGPYICAEWDMGGLPSWLLRDPQMQLRNNYRPYTDAVTRYWNRLMGHVSRYQFSYGGGPIIALQLENEYFGATGLEHSFDYLRLLRNLTVKSGFRELLFCSDPADKAVRVPLHQQMGDLFQTANLNRDSAKWLSELKRKQPGKPGFITEFWPGWFDQWDLHEKHHHYSLADFDREISDALFKVNGSVNFYMFIGGTNFGFMNGGRVVTSYDYDSPLTESGNYTEKYDKTLELYRKLVQTKRLPELKLPARPKLIPAANYGHFTIADYYPFMELVKVGRNFELPEPKFMEHLPMGPGYGQRFGFVMYRVETEKPIEKFEITGNY